jgi:integrase
MASVYKRAGAKKYTITYKDHNGRRRELLGCADKQASEKIANKLEADVMFRKRGLIDPAQEKLAEQEKTPLAEHLEDFEDNMKINGDTPKHIDRTIHYIEMINTACGFVTASNIEAEKVKKFLGGMKARGYYTMTRVTLKGPQQYKKDFGNRTFNSYLTAIKSFTNWLYTTDRIRSDPLKSLARDIKGERTDKRYTRRALGDDEVERLLAAAETGPDYMNMNGHDRSVLYQLALGTGFRAAELRSLAVGSFDLADKNNATATVLACYSKRKRDDHQPISPQLAELMADYIIETRKHPNTPLFDLPQKTSKMVKAEMDRARFLWINEAKTSVERESRERSDFLRYKDSEGRAADFHALRHTFITRLIRSGVSPTIVKILARHSTFALTIDRYTHILNGDTRSALNQLPDFSGGRQELRKTGTDDQPASSGLQHRLQHSDCPKGQNLSSPVTVEMKEQLELNEKVGCDKAAQNGQSGKVLHYMASLAEGGKGNWALLDSNQRPGDYESPALTN